MGRYLVDSVTEREVNAVAGVTVVLAVLVVVAGFIADVLQALLDPRVAIE
jgi:peptide/nickel transport system permease protein